MTDKDFLLKVLSDGNWHSLEDILRYSQDERGHGFDVRTRASELRKQGFTVTCEVKAGRRRKSFYRLESHLPLTAA